VARIKLRVAQKRLATATNRLTGIPNGDREPISIPTNEQQRNRFQVEVIKMTDEGQIGGNLAEAALSTFGFDASSAEDQRRLSPAVTNIPDMCEMGYDNDSQLQEAINNMDVNAILQSLPDSAKAGGTQGYKDDLQRRYTGATKTYSENVNRAKEAIIAYNNSGKTPGTRNPALLAQVQEAIKAAMGSSAVIRDIKLEIENNTKK